LAQRSTRSLNRERSEVLARVEGWLELPMIVLGFAWLALLVIELTRGLSPVMDIMGRAIWIVFIVEFALKLILALRKLPFVRNNWLTVIALIIPALRVFRLFAVARALRLARVARGLRLLRLVTSLTAA
jgi:voltage-gated potassium channel